MAARARHSGSRHAASPEPSAPQPAAATGGEASIPAPAHRLQELLETRLLAEADFAEADEKRWPPFATLAFIVATCGGFWGVVIFAAIRLL
jgi:hypothetical protein